MALNHGGARRVRLNWVRVVVVLAGLLAVIAVLGRLATHSSEPATAPLDEDALRKSLASPHPR